MDQGVELAIDQPDRLVSRLAIFVAERRKNQTVLSFPYTLSKRERQPMLEAVGLVLRGIELELHCM